MKVINLFGGPGAGKSTTAAGLFWMMKNMGLRVELVTEYAKALAWAQRGAELTDQFYIYAKQHHRQHVLRGQVDWVITDSPLLLTLLYVNPTIPASYRQFVVDNFHTYNNVNFFIHRVKPYVALGRWQDEVGADEIGRRTQVMLQEHNLTTIGIPGDEHSTKHIIESLKMGGHL